MTKAPVKFQNSQHKIVVGVELGTPSIRFSHLDSNNAITAIQGGGGTLNFSAYVGSGPASTLHPKKYQEF